MKVLTDELLVSDTQMMSGDGSADTKNLPSMPHRRLSYDSKRLLEIAKITWKLEESRFYRIVHEGTYRWTAGL